MTGAFFKQSLSVAMSFVMVVTALPSEAAAQEPGPTGYSGQGVPLSAQELQQLAAPIALYPDALVAQIFGAATFPDQVAAASLWLKQNSSLTGTALTQAVDMQPWDPSVKALSQFPSVLDNLANNLSWTSSLGEAYSTQAADLMSAVQTLRSQAKAAGTEIRIANYRGAAIAPGNRNSARQSAGRLCSAVQSHDCVRRAVRNAGI